MALATLPPHAALCLALLMAVVAGLPVPSPCPQCGGGRVSCRGLGLNSPPGPGSATALRPDGDLPHVPPRPDDPAPTPISVLLLENCSLSHLPAGAFSGLVGLRRLSLNGNGLRRVDVRTFGGLANLQELLLHDNLIDVLPRNIFLGLTSLRHLQLQNNLLEVVRDGLFAGAGRLSTLRLDNNLIWRISDTAFARRSELRSLFLSNNNLTQIPSSAFVRLKNLNRLVFSGNRVTWIHPFAFKALAKLTHLILDDLQLQGISSNGFSGLGNTRHLSLRRNYLKTLSADILRPLVKLEELRLDGNILTALCDDLLTGPAASLRVLTLTKNRLSHVSPAPFLSSTNLARLQLTDNPLPCDCGALALRLWMGAAAARVDLRCRSPGRLRGLQLSRVAWESLGDCDVQRSPKPEGARSLRPASPRLVASSAPGPGPRNDSAAADASLRSPPGQRRIPESRCHTAAVAARGESLGRGSEPNAGVASDAALENLPGRVDDRRMAESYGTSVLTGSQMNVEERGGGSGGESGGSGARGSSQAGPSCEHRAAEIDAAFNAVLGLLIVSLVVAAVSAAVASRLWRRLRDRGGGIVESCSPARSLTPRYRPSYRPTPPPPPPPPPLMADPRLRAGTPCRTVALDRALLLRLCEDEGPQVVLFEHTVL